MFSATEEFSTQLQNQQTTVDEAISQASVLKSHFTRRRTSDAFEQFYEQVLKESSPHTDPPVLKRPRKPPKKIDSGSTPHLPETPKDMYRALYFEISDIVISEIDTRLGIKNLNVPMKVEGLLLSAFNETGNVDENVCDSICKFYGSDIDKTKLIRQLNMVPDLLLDVRKDERFKSLKTISKLSTIVDIFVAFPSHVKLFSELQKLIKLFMTIPVSTASAERSFSALRRLKTYLRSRMNQARLNHVLMLHCHKDKTDQISLKAVAQEFVEKKDQRQAYFGQFIQK